MDKLIDGEECTRIDGMTLEDYFELHPDEEAEFIDEMAERSYINEIIDYPEDWVA